MKTDYVTTTKNLLKQATLLCGFPVFFLKQIQSIIKGILTASPKLAWLILVVPSRKPEVEVNEGSQKFT